MPRASESAGDLWAKAAELERDFAGYKRRLAERRACAAVAAAAGDGGGTEDEEQITAEATGRGRRYEEYVRRRDERLRQEWRARMERKEAEMKALWARLDRASSRGRRGGGGELPSASHDRDQQKAGSLEVKLKPVIAPVTPRCSPATKTARPRTSSVPSSPAAANPRLSTPDPRRRPPHLHRNLPQAEPPATPRKENRLPPPSSTAAAPATPRPRTTLSRSRSMLKDRSSWSSGRESPRPPRFQPPRTSCDSASNIKEAPLSPDDDDDAVGVVQQSRPCFSEDAVLARLNKACAAAVAPEPFHLGRSGRSGAEPASSSLLLATPSDEPDRTDIAPAGCNNAESKPDNNGDNADQSSDKSGSSPDITGDSDTEPSYVLVRRDSGEQTPRFSQLPPAGPGTCPQVELLRSEDKGSCNFEGTTVASSEPNTIAGDAEEEASRRASSESLYSNVRSSFSQRSAELDTSATSSPLRSPASCTSTTPSPTDPSPVDDASRQEKKNPEEEDAENNNPGSSVTVSITVQSPMDAMAGLKRFLSFGKTKNGNGKAGEVSTTVVERAPRSLAPAAGDRSMSRGCPTDSSVKRRTGCSDSDVAASEDLDNCYVISPRVRSLQSFTPSSPANPELKEAVLHAKSPRVHRSFFSLSSFKSRAS